ncbi:hypothetical protein EKD04_009530 [Chloroflexales bacterium ZM16-3]|nr:hypothetical protein [Chloroflexales bacterium ZM16-3]
MTSSAILTPTDLDHMLGTITSDNSRLEEIRRSAEGRVLYLNKAGEVSFLEAMRAVNVGPTSMSSGGTGSHVGMTLPSDGHSWIELGSPSVTASGSDGSSGSSGKSGFTPNSKNKR